MLFFISPNNEVDIRKERVKMHLKNVFFSDFFHSPSNGKDPRIFNKLSLVINALDIMQICVHRNAEYISTYMTNTIITFTFHKYGV